MKAIIIASLRSMLRFLGLSLGDGKDDKAARTLPDRSLPSSWYRSTALFELERRAIFSRRWILITHRSRLVDVGDFLSITYAGFPFFLILDRQGNVNGFHNICRHKAYPILQKPCGRALVLGCKYHGWSYGFNGNLAKAPGFGNVPGFDRGQHGLLPVRVHVDKVGFVWINLEAGTGNDPEVKWDDHFKGADENARLTRFALADEYKYDHTWTLDIDANWKSVMENYNECYHCQTSHPLIARASDLAKYRVDPNGGCLEHTIVNKSREDEVDHLRRSITFFFPSTSVTVT